jgi:putative protease
VRAVAISPFRRILKEEFLGSSVFAVGDPEWPIFRLNSFLPQKTKYRCDMKKKIELLAPGGDIDAIKAAIIAGADAIYCGLDRFNARNRAKNLVFDDLHGIIRLAHQYDCKVFLTLNIIIVDPEIPALIHLLNRLVNTRIDAVIVQDLGMFYLLGKYFPDLVIHASTQLTTHNEGQIKFLKRLNAARVNLSRELNIAEITDLTTSAHKEKILTEVFVHGSNCISFSGLCYFSSVHGGNSGNRGRCSQPCRDQYARTAAGKDFPLNLKDNCAYSDLRELAEAGVDSIKIEGRIKKFHYVYIVVKSWREQLRNLCNHNTTNNENHDLRKVFNRDFTNGYLQGDINASMFIDNPRDNSAIHLAETDGAATPEKIEEAKRELYDLKTDIIADVRARIRPLTIKKKILLKLNDCRERIAPVSVPRLKKRNSTTVAPTLSLLISSRKDLHLCHETSADIYFQIPDGLTKRYEEFVNLFQENKDLLPWFPPVLIGEDYHTAVKLLHQMRPPLIVTNNTGIGYEACRQEIPWVAGPYMNIVNSFSLLCLKEKFNCSGSFISNEINRMQIRSIRRPDDFKLYYSIFHPIMLMTSRQCLLRQVTGCTKESIDDECIQQCVRSSSITNLKQIKLLIKKTEGNYHRLYSDIHYLNTEISVDVQNFFSNFLVDLRDIPTRTTVKLTKREIVALFEKHLSGNLESTEELKQAIHPSTNTQYRKGI